MRVTMSIAWPGANPTMMRTGRDGEPCALATRETAERTAAPTVRCRKFRRVSFTVANPASAFSLDHLVRAGKQERGHIETIALAALSLFIPFSQSIMLTPFWALPASAARALR